MSRRIGLSHSKGIRLFKNNFMEALTHVHPSIPLCVWGPIALWLLWRGAIVHGYGPADFAIMLIAGGFAWTLIEYSVHRFMFHFKASPGWASTWCTSSMAFIMTTRMIEHGW